MGAAMERLGTRRRNGLGTLSQWASAPWSSCCPRPAASAVSGTLSPWPTAALCLRVQCAEVLRRHVPLPHHQQAGRGPQPPAGVPGRPSLRPARLPSRAQVVGPGKRRKLLIPDPTCEILLSLACFAQCLG